MSDAIIVVSGLPRSGTSMMMSMLDAGGIPIVTDGERKADADNPKGYFELERVKRLDRDADWLRSCRGKAMKVISQLLMSLPEDHHYDVLFMRRNLDEVLTSQRKMLKRRGEPEGPPDEEMKTTLLSHLDEIEAWLEARPRFRVKYVSYNRMFTEAAAQIGKIEAFLGPRFDGARARAAIDAGLYRNRK